MAAFASQRQLMAVRCVNTRSTRITPSLARASRHNSARSSTFGVCKLPGQLVGAPGASVLLKKSVHAAVSSASASGSRQETVGLNIVFVSTEVAPWSKTGGLGDVVGGLPVELAKLGHKVMSISPRYDQYADAWDTSVTVDIDGKTVRYFHTKKKGVDRVFIDHPDFLARVWGKTGALLYGKKSGADYVDNQQRFLLFNKAAIQALTVLPFSPGEDTVVVCNDWHTALFPVLIKDVHQPRGEFTKTKVTLCVHNIAFQGRFWRDMWDDLGLPERSKEKFLFEDGYDRIFTETEPADEFEGKSEKLGKVYKKINWLKAGFLSADKVLTVSPNYATEITSSEAKGVELDDIIRLAGVEGIVNGMDTDEWSPKTDKFLDVNYDAATVAEGKALAKEALQAELGLPVDPSVPLFGFIGRLEEQKGVDILLAALPKALAAGKAQVAVLGTGKKVLEKAVAALDTKFPDAAKGVVKFSAPLAHMITAGADYMLVPSRFEPCGLIQLHAMQYGTVPLVASTGGLVDTVSEGVTGLHFGGEPFDADSLAPQDVATVAATMARAVDLYGTPAYAAMRAKAISQELSWKLPAQKWAAVLEQVAAPETQRSAKGSVETPVQQVASSAAVA